MTRDRDFKQVVRDRARKTGESYAAARRQLMSHVGSSAKAPAHWRMTGSHPQEYTHEVDPSDSYKGKRVAVITFTAQGEPGGFGATVQTFAAEAFLNKRVRFSAALRAEAVDGWTGLWFRVDDDAGRTVGFDNMENRAVTGTTNWQPVNIVLDVPRNAGSMLIGVILEGRGSARIADMQLDVVDPSVPVTGGAAPGKAVLSPAPINLDLADDDEATE